MKTICVTGLLPYYNDAAMDILVLGGVTPAARSPRDDTLDMRTWHERLTHSLGDLPSPGLEPGRLWEQLAGDVFMANLHVPMWGWADSASLGLLDFWRDFDAGVHFLLLHVRAEQWLADQLANGATDPVKLLAQWESATQEILRFHLRNQDRSSIVDATLAVQAPRRLLEVCSSRWSLPLNTQSDFAPAPPERGILPIYLGNQIAAAAEVLTDLQHEIDSTCIDLGAGCASAVVGLTDVLAEYRQHSTSTQRLVVCDQELHQVKLNLVAESQRATRLDAENGQLLFQLQAVQEELQAAIKSFDTQHAQQQEQHANSQRQLQTQLNSVAETLAARDAAIALAQEVHAEEHSRLEQELAAQAIKLANSASTQKQLQAENKQLNSELKHLRKKLRELELSARDQSALRTELERDNAHLLLQFTSVQEDLELALQARQQDGHTLATANADTARLTQELEQSNAHLKRWQQRATRMERHLPGYVDYQSLAMIPIKRKGHGLAHCRLVGLEHTDGVRDVTFTLLLENGTVGFAFERAVHALTSWPPAAEGREVVDIMPTSHPTDNLLRAATLKQLSTSDWLLIQQLIRVLKFALTEPGRFPEGLAANAGDVSKGLEQLHHVLDQLPPVLRFDSAELVRAYASEAYEHLEIRLRDVMLGSRRAEEFIFRLACAHAQGMPFGTHPRIEFPQSNGPNLFESWFEESSNIHGPKLELRFALPDLMDLDVWQKISPADQALIRSLYDQLEDIVCMVSASAKAELPREWNHWSTLAAGMHRTLALRSASKAPDADEQHLPGTGDYQSLTLLPIKRDGHGLAQCRVTGLAHAGGRRDVTFTLLLENGTIGFAFEQSGNALARWPRVAEGREVVDIIPTGHPTDNLLRATTLKQLSTSDWLLTQQLMHILNTALAEPGGMPKQLVASVDNIGNGLVQLRHVLDRLPPIFRFDKADLVRAYANDDYEHLEIRLRGVMLGSLHSEEFVFRLGCAHAQGVPFGTHPRIEFPQSTSASLFERWFEESRNIHGPKLELRFATPDLMDLNVWQKISPADQALIVALCDQLEDIVSMVSANATAKLPREWGHWSGLAAGMRRTLALRTARKALVPTAIHTLS